MPQAKLEGKKVRLRPKSLQDAAQDYAWSQDEELCHLEAVYPVSVPFASYLQIYALELNNEPGSYQRFAIDTMAGEHIGNCMVYQMDQGKGEAELGILIGNRAFWNQGYGVEAVTLLVAHLFATTGLSRVYLHTLAWNHRARRCFEKCGFVRCGEEPRWGQRFVVMEIRRSWWEKQRGGQSSPPREQGGEL